MNSFSVQRDRVIFVFFRVIGQCRQIISIRHLRRRLKMCNVHSIIGFISDNEVDSGLFCRFSLLFIFPVKTLKEHEDCVLKILDLLWFSMFHMNNKENRQNKPLSTSLSLMKPIILWTLHIFNLRLKCVIDIIQLRYTFLYNGILLNLWIRFLSNRNTKTVF
jgi:hypothetical protein